MLPSSIARTVYWTIQPARGRGDLSKKFGLLKDTQWLSRDEMEELSFRKLEQLLLHSYETVPYYRALMDHHGFDPRKMRDASDLSKLPVLTRDQLEQNFDRLQSTKIGEYHAHESCSSGSTGQPARFMQDEGFDSWARAHQLRTYGWCGDWEVGEKFALVWGSPVYWDKQTLERKIEAYVTNRVELNCNNLGEENLQRILDGLQKFDPVLISGYSTALYLVTELAKKQGVTLKNLRALQPNAEPSYDYMVKSMKDQFGVAVYDKYGSTETNMISHQSPEDEAIMCIQAENSHVEFLNEDGIACKSGEDGRVVVTTLNNYSMPLIRYQTSDIASPIEGLDPSGRGFPLMSKVRGRLYDLIRTPKGEKIHPQVFSNLFSNFTEVTWFQIVQNEAKTLDISLMMRGGEGNQHLESTFLKMINLRTGGDFEARFRYLDSMPVTKTGKHKLCVCNIGEPQ